MAAKALLLGAILVVSIVGGSCMGYRLKNDFYRKSCSSVEATVRDITVSRVKANPELGAKLLRLFFHDCFVRGCDASILLDSTSSNKAEKDAGPNLSVAGYEVIDDIKSQLEEDCPGVVSCADIIALATKAAVNFMNPEVTWKVYTGRKDGRISLASDALLNLPSPFSNITTLKNSFANKGLDTVDLVALSGAHTIGITHCGLVTSRLYNFTGKGDSDPSLSPNYTSFLMQQCPQNGNPRTIIEMDPGSSLSFDRHYYRAVRQNMGIFKSDATLLTDLYSSFLVKKMEKKFTFYSQFGHSMTKMGGIGVLVGKDGEVRKNCRMVN